MDSDNEKIKNDNIKNDLKKSLESFNQSELSQSQQDRKNIKPLIEDTMVDFLNTIMTRTTSEEGLKNDLMVILKERAEVPFNDEEGRQIMSTGHIIDALKVLSTNDNELILGILDILKEKQKAIVMKQQNDFVESKIPKPPSVTREDTEIIRQLIESLDSFIKTEHNEEELELIKKTAKENQKIRQEMKKNT